MHKSLILIILAALLCFSSCGLYESDIKNRLVVEGVGIDYNKGKKEYELTVQALSVSKESGEGSSPAAGVINYKATGSTVSGALDSIGEITGKIPLYSQNRIIVLGNDLKEDVAAAALDNFVREYTARTDVFLCMAQGRAQDIMEAKGVSNVPAEEIEKAITRCIDDSIEVNGELYKIVNLIKEDNSQAVLPLVKADSSAVAKTPTVKVIGSTILSDNKNTLTTEETMYLLFLQNKIQSGRIDLLYNSIPTGISIIKSKTKITPDITDGKICFNIKIDTTADIVEYGSSDFKRLDSETINKIKTAAEGKIKKGIDELIYRQLKEKRCDIFRFNRMLLNKYPGSFKAIEENWEQMLPNIKTDTSVKLTIRKIGQEAIK